MVKFVIEMALFSTGLDAGGSALPAERAALGLADAAASIGDGRRSRGQAPALV